MMDGKETESAHLSYALICENRILYGGETGIEREEVVVLQLTLHTAFWTRNYKTEKQTKQDD